MARQLTRCQMIERSINKKYRKELWAPFMTAIVKYELISPGDKIAVCISGGKDSMLMAKLMQELHKHTRVPFDLIYLVMDPGYNPINRKKIESNAALLEVPIQIFETDIFDVANKQTKSPCYLCARMRRGHLYAKAKELGCNKIALGHHMSDVIETVVMAMMNSSKLETIVPKVHSLNFEGMELIRPMYLIREKDIIRWRDFNELRFLQCACRFTEAIAQPADSDEPSISKRLETKRLIAALSQTIPQVENNLFKATENVVLNKVLGYKIHGEKHTFLEDY